MQFAFVQMDGVYSGGANIAKLNCVQYCADFLQANRVNILADAPQSKVWGEGSFLFFVAEAGCACFHILLQGGQFCQGVDSCP